MIYFARSFLVGLTSLSLAACSFLGLRVSGPTPAPVFATQPIFLTPGTTPVPVPHVTATLPPAGSTENPIILALPPAPDVDATRLEAAKAFAAQLAELTGFTFVVVAPQSYAKLVTALGQGNAHIAVLSPYAYTLAYENGAAEAAFASLRSGEKTYGAQFIARADGGVQSYFDAQAGENTAAAAQALSQFRDQKPCWSDESSLSGYVIPAGVLAHNGIITGPGAFLQGQPTVARAIYVGGICDFGATYIDARTFPALREDYPDALEKIAVIWRVPPIIPYDVLVLSKNLPAEVRQALQAALFRASGTQAGRTVLGQAYDVEIWEPVTDAFYVDFRLFLQAAEVDLTALVN